QTGSFHLDQSEVSAAVDADDLCVGERATSLGLGNEDFHTNRSSNHVRVGDDVALRIYHYSGSGRSLAGDQGDGLILPLIPAAITAHQDLNHRGRDSLRQRADRQAVFGQSVLLGRLESV